MITADLRPTLIRHSVCPSARRAITSGHYFVFEGEAGASVLKVADFLREARLSGQISFEENIVPFARTPFDSMAVEVSWERPLDDGYVGLIWCLSDSLASFYGVMTEGGIVCLGEGLDTFIDRLEGDDLSPFGFFIVLSCLLILNRPAEYSLSSQPAYRKVVGGKLRPFAAHHVVAVSVSPTRLIRLIKGGSSGVRLRRHERRGHFSHRGGNEPACVHRWVREEYDRNEHWRCADCGRLRYWIRPHDVGDASIGFVTKQYAVRDSSPDGRRVASAGGLGA